MTDFATWLAAQPDPVQNEHVRQQQHRDGQRLTRILLAPAVLIAACFVSLPIVAAYLFIPWLFQAPVLAGVGVVVVALMVALDRWDNARSRSSRSVVLRTTVLLVLPLLGLVASAHFLLALAELLDWGFDQGFAGLTLIVLGALSTAFIHQTLWRCIAGLGLALGLWMLAGWFPLLFLGPLTALFPPLLLLALMASAMLLERGSQTGRSPGFAGWINTMRGRLWAVRDASGFVALAAAAIMAASAAPFPLVFLVVPAITYMLAGLCWQRGLQVFSVVSFVAVLIVNYYASDLSFLLKAAWFGGLAVALGVGSFLPGRLERIGAGRGEGEGDGS